MDEDDVVVSKEANVQDALRYVHQAIFPLHQPSKSRVVAIIYATLISKDYGGVFFDILNDPELLTDDPFFVPYDQDKQGYDCIIKALGPFDTWKDSAGWIIRTRQYYWLECTNTGVEFASAADDAVMQAYLAQRENVTTWAGLKT
jgi:hypothetical protein